MDAHTAREALAELLDQHGLPGQRLIAAVEAVDVGLPYHGPQHCFDVALRAFDGATHYHDLEPIRFALAGLFHDAGYRRGRPDAENIADAIALWRSVIAGVSGEQGERLAALSPRVEELIGFTKFPWSTTDFAACVMTDSDIMGSILDPTWIERLVQESGAAGSAEWARARMRTRWGRERTRQ